MGYSICASHNKRTCDICDRCPDDIIAGKTVRFKYARCPHGWCPTYRVCPECWPKHKHEFTHSKCKENSERADHEQRMRQLATDEGKPVIRAGVGLPNGNVFTWTTQGNFEVAKQLYRQGLERADRVVCLDNAVSRAEKSPPEVYGN